MITTRWWAVSSTSWGPRPARGTRRQAAARSREFSWPQSATAMRCVLESVKAGDRVSGVI